MLELGRLSVNYGDVQALWDVNLKVEEGSITALLGSNGAGKTTTVKTVAGILKPASGEVRFRGEPLHILPPHRIVERGIVLIPEGRSLFPRMTVLENLEMGAYNRRARAERAENLKWIYELFPHLKERRHQAMGTMSGGEQQMVAIGRGLMASPQLLMVDEPSLGLAPLLVDELFEVLKSINRRGITLLLVEQNVQRSLEIADSAYVLETGRVSLWGKAEELLQNPFVQRTYMGL